jgi:hypothetical protein
MRARLSLAGSRSKQGGVEIMGFRGKPTETLLMMPETVSRTRNSTAA